MLSDLTIDFNLAFAFRWDADAQVHVGFCPALGLYSQGRSETEAEDAVASAAALFIGTCYDRDILHTVLREKGMTKVSAAPTEAVKRERQYIAVSGFDRVIERQVPIHLLFPNREGVACH